MSDTIEPGGTASDLVHVHICVRCGHPRLRESVDEVEIQSGILHCPRCGFDGPLNIEIRNLAAE